MEFLYSTISSKLERGSALVVARVIRQQGSAPRPVGAMCIILPDGSLYGSVGGGQFEEKVRLQALEIIGQECAILQSFRLQNENAANTGMICGGNVDILLENISPDKKEATVYTRAANVLKQEKNGLLYSLVPETNAAKIEAKSGFMEEEGKCWGDLPAPQVLADSKKYWKQPGLVRTETGNLLFVCPVLPEPHLIIFGAGHISLSLAKLASTIKFRTTIVDDREDFAHPERFPQAEEIITSPFELSFEQLNITPNSYLAILTRGHLYDREVLSRALTTQAAYIGMIGSKKKIGAIFDALRQEGFSEQSLEKVHTPIGVDIGASTPEEISLSIAAELVQVRNKEY